MDDGLDGSLTAFADMAQLRAGLGSEPSNVRPSIIQFSHRKVYEYPSALAKVPSGMGFTTASPLNMSGDAYSFAVRSEAVTSSPSG